MPGIAGIISKTFKKSYEQDLNLMINCMLHEPFYTFGTYINDQLGFYIGWVCLKNSFADCMPVLNEIKDLVLIFSGENFIDEELINRLKRNDHQFDKINASYLIHLYEKLGEEKFLKHLNGFFCGILMNVKKKRGILFNDRYGMQRLYIYESKDAFLFSSEAKSLLRIRPELREIDMKDLGEFFSCNCVMEDRTLFSKISLLPKGSAWTFHEDSSIEKKSYFKKDEWENQTILDDELFYERLKETFHKILPRYFSSEQTIALSLTGGLDTRMILASRENLPNSLPCCTNGGIYRDSFDVKVARKVAELCNQPYQVLRVGKDFFADFPNLAEKTVFITDGNLDVTQSVGLYTNRLVRNFAAIRMTGNYGSEVMRGTIMFKPSSPCETLFDPDFYKFIRQTKNTYDQHKTGNKVSFIVFKQVPWYHYNRFVLEQSQITQRSPYMDNDLVKLIYQGSEKVIHTDSTVLRLISDLRPELGAIKSDRGIGGKSIPVFSLLSRAYLEFLFKMDYYYNHGMPQWLAKFDNTFSFLKIEKIFLGRHKYNHFRVWFRDQLSHYVREILLDERTLNRPYLNRKFIERMVNDHIKAEKNYTNEITMILTSELMRRLLIEQ